MYEINNISFDYKKTLEILYEYFYKKSINKFTAFARIDNQIQDIFGNYLYVLDLLPNHQGSEIGWHPHCYTKLDNKYYPEYNTDCIIRQLWKVFASTHKVREAKSFRMGGAIMDNKIMSTLEQMGFLIDSSALPGCERNDLHRKFDWTITGNSQYHPCKEDYRCSGSSPYKLLEVPMTTIPIAAPYDKITKRRYINPTIKSEIFKPYFYTYSHYLSHIVITFHPDQLIDGHEDDLYRYGMDNFISNMEFIQQNQDVNYKTLLDLYNE